MSRGAAADAVARFCRGLVDAVAPYIVGVKPQLAFFEALGADGLSAFEDVCAYARAADLLVVADGKRGRHRLDGPRLRRRLPRESRTESRRRVDALTVNPYLGSDSIEPLLAACRRAGTRDLLPREDLQRGQRGHPGRSPSPTAAASGSTWPSSSPSGARSSSGDRGLSSVGAVVGATYPRAVGEARRLMPKAILLLPGIGAQGATAGDVARAFTSGPASALVPVSRAVIYAFRVDGADWRKAAAAEAARLRAEVWAVSGW